METELPAVLAGHPTETSSWVALMAGGPGEHQRVEATVAEQVVAYLEAEGFTVPDGRALEVPDNFHLNV